MTSSTVDRVRNPIAQWMDNAPEKDVHALFQRCIDEAKEKTKSANLATEEERLNFYFTACIDTLMDALAKKRSDAVKKTADEKRDESASTD